MLKTVRLWAKCNYCGHSAFTNKLELFDLLAKAAVDDNDEVPIIVCGGCGAKMDNICILMCAVDKGDELCNKCEYRFKCFTEDTENGSVKKA